MSMGNSPQITNYDYDPTLTVPALPGSEKAGWTGTNPVPSKGAAAGDAASEDATSKKDPLPPFNDTTDSDSTGRSSQEEAIQPGISKINPESRSDEPTPSMQTDESKFIEQRKGFLPAHSGGRRHLKLLLIHKPSEAYCLQAQSLPSPHVVDETATDLPGKTCARATECLSVAGAVAPLLSWPAHRSFPEVMRSASTRWFASHPSFQAEFWEAFVEGADGQNDESTRIKSSALYDNGTSVLLVVIMRASSETPVWVSLDAPDKLVDLPLDQSFHQLGRGPDHELTMPLRVVAAPMLPAPLDSAGPAFLFRQLQKETRLCKQHLRTSAASLHLFPVATCHDQYHPL